ncbi:uncharacterized protein LOC128193876 [Vigna angularis]|uniref:uncharacterized protein LOC128193876 n=1 Tax=Phaseolus angularis TaxID=3914 RepID=UPI0022B418B6|nr:uncharacterized protein LOC128193876 [Vigna angularis]
MKQKSDSRLPLSEGCDPPPPPSPPSRHEKWKLARIRPSGSYTSESAREISERIDSLVEQSSQGQFTQEGRQDILATAIGRPEHPGRVRGAGTGIGIRQFFGSSSRPYSYEKMKEEIRKEMTQEITKKVRVRHAYPHIPSPLRQLFRASKSFFFLFQERQALEEVLVDEESEEVDLSGGNEQGLDEGVGEEENGRTSLVGVHEANGEGAKGEVAKVEEGF